jgi:hypothetical protein
MDRDQCVESMHRQVRMRRLSTESGNCRIESVCHATRFFRLVPSHVGFWDGATTCAKNKLIWVQTRALSRCIYDVFT